MQFHPTSKRNKPMFNGDFQHSRVCYTVLTHLWCFILLFNKDMSISAVIIPHFPPSLFCHLNPVWASSLVSPYDWPNKLMFRCWTWMHGSWNTMVTKTAKTINLGYIVEQLYLLGLWTQLWRQCWCGRCSSGARPCWALCFSAAVSVQPDGRK